MAAQIGQFKETHPFVLRFKSDLLHGHNLVGLLVASLKVNHFKLEITNKQWTEWLSSNVQFLHFPLRYLEDHPIGALANLLNLVEVFQPVACLAWGHPFSRDFLWSTMLDWFLLLYKICLLIYWSHRSHQCKYMVRLLTSTKRIVSRERYFCWLSFYIGSKYVFYIQN